MMELTLLLLNITNKKNYIKTNHLYDSNLEVNYVPVYQIKFIKY